MLANLKKHRCAALVLVMGLCLVACSSASVVPEPRSFETQTTIDGSKRFVFAVRSGRAAENMAMEEHLERYMEQIGYCNDGYFIYDQQFDGSTYRFLGECQESAQ